MIGTISKLFGGNKSEKDVKKITPQVEKINLFFTQYQSLSNDDLRNKTIEFKKRIADHLLEIDRQIAALKLKSLGVSIDQLTAEQQHYLSSWEIGT